MFSLENRRFWVVLTVGFQYLKEAYVKAGEGLFNREHSDRTKSNGFQLKDNRLRLDTRRKFFTWSMVRHWYRMP